MRPVGVLSVLLAAAALVGTARPAPGGSTLSGVTQISYGCPGPQRVSEQCQRWLVFGNARFALSNGRRTTVVTSDRQGRFSIVVSPGTYRLIPLPQAHTKGGVRLSARIGAGRTTRVL